MEGLETEETTEEDTEEGAEGLLVWVGVREIGVEEMLSQGSLDAAAAVEGAFPMPWL